jgi:hypothetical protein
MNMPRVVFVYLLSRFVFHIIEESGGGGMQSGHKSTGGFLITTTSFPKEVTSSYQPRLRGSPDSSHL